MRIYAVADIHGRTSAIRTIEKTGAETRPDVLVVAGDITGHGREEATLSDLDALPWPVFVIPGNIDPFGLDSFLPGMKNLTWIHETQAHCNGLHFVGLGGGLTEIFGKKGAQGLEAVGSLVGRETILVTHCPPWDVLDKGFLGLRSGSKELERIITEKKPKLHICGHIHECPGVENLGETVVVNCSMGRTGAGAIIDLDKTGAVQARIIK